MPKSKQKPKPVRLDADATTIILGWSQLTKRSESFIASQFIGWTSGLVLGTIKPADVKAALDGLVNVASAEKKAATLVREAKAKAPKMPPRTVPSGIR